ncbi:MAG: MarR family transcriptional regulator [Alphaproteobacteria bacterium]|nr:MarR family transcriptional regulator [Alphaproteobacteria bacterium]
MSCPTSFVDQHEFRHAFLGNRLERAVNLIAAQGEALLVERGCTFASYAASTLLFISHTPDCAMADIAAALNMPHQVIAQRLEALEKQDLVYRKPDAKDGRRKVVVLTDRGMNEVERLRGVLRDADMALRALNAELGFDASDGAMKLIAALHRMSLSDRIAHHRAGAEADVDKKQGTGGE